MEYSRANLTSLRTFMRNLVKPLLIRCRGFFQTVSCNDAEKLDVMPRRERGENLVMFIHGLSGSALGTWEPMLRAFESDPDLNTYSFDCYAYPTALNRLPLTRRMAGIQEIANGLRTHIEANYGNNVNLILVGHSLGGIVARQYILDEIKCGRGANFLGVALFATPHTGAALANVGSLFSSTHRHLKQLCKGADILELINTDWVRLKVEDKLRTLYVVGGADAVVARESAAPYLGSDNVRTLIEFGHREIIKPSDITDSRYKILKGFIKSVTPQSGIKICRAKEQDGQKGDVLFDFYTTSSEGYYIKRPTDMSLENATKTSHVWVSGPPGLGKTVSLKRLIDVSGWAIQHVLLDSYIGLSALELMREVCNTLCDRVGIEPDGIPKDIDASGLLYYFRKVFSELSDSSPIAILIEEIPLPSGEEYTAFLTLAYHLTLCAETSDSTSRVIWLFSSIRNPKPDIQPNNPKFLERMQFVEFEPWPSPDIEELIDLICTSLDIDMKTEDRELLVDRSKGSPRFVKMLFRRRRNEAVVNKPLQELLSSVELDLS